jgi:voltage-gated potassium channel
MQRLRAATDTLKELAFLYTVLLLGCTSLFMLLERQDFLTSLYWAGATATSTGYGDIAPKTFGGQILAFVLMHISIFGVAPLIIVRLVDRLNENRDAFTHEEQVHILEGIQRIEADLKVLRGEREAKE